MFRSTCAGIAILIACTAFGQAPAATKSFEVATIKPTDPTFGGILIQVPAGNLSLRGFTLTDIIGFAYNMDNHQVLGVPKLLESARYDVLGKADKPLAANTAGIDEGKVMLQALLADRFQLKFHKETREIPIYILTVAKGGHKMKARTEGAGAMTFVPSRNCSATAMSGRPTSRWCTTATASTPATWTC